MHHSRQYGSTRDTIGIPYVTPEYCTTPAFPQYRALILPFGKHQSPPPSTDVGSSIRKGISSPRTLHAYGLNGCSTFFLPGKMIKGRSFTMCFPTSPFLPQKTQRARPPASTVAITPVEKCRRSSSRGLRPVSFNAHKNIKQAQKPSCHAVFVHSVTRNPEIR